MPEGAPGRDRHAVGTGMVVALFCAVSYGLVMPFTRFSYDYGVNPETAVVFRLSLAALVATGVVLALNRSVAIPRQGVLSTLAATLGLAAASLCYNSAVAFISVTFTVLIVYTYPLMIAAYVTLVQGAVLGWPRACAFLIAFAGLSLTLGPSFQDLDWRGVLLALGAAVSVVAMFIASSAALRHSNVTTLAFYTNLGGVPLTMGYLWLFGALGLPTEAPGWIGHLGAALCYALGIFANLAAIALGGPARTAMILNLEPIVAMAAAAVLLGERMTAQQYAGGALVIAALMLSAWADLARRRVAAP